MVVVVPMATILVHTLNVLQLVNLNSSFLKAILEKFQHFANSKLRQEYADSISKDIISIWPESDMIHFGGDEVILDCWNGNKEINDFKTKNGIKSN